MTFSQIFAATLKVMLSLVIIAAVCGLIYGIGSGLASTRYDPQADLAARNARINRELDADLPRIIQEGQKWGPVVDRCSRHAREPEANWPAECKTIPAKYRPLLLKYAPLTTKAKARTTDTGRKVGADGRRWVGGEETTAEVEQDFARMEREQRALVARCKPYAGKPEFEWPKECTDMPPQLRELAAQP